MIRVSTALWGALAAVVGFGLFQLKHEVQELEDELFRLNRAVLAEQQAIHVLKAEWSYINQPQRLQSLAARHLELQPMQPAQLGTLAALPARPAEPDLPAMVAAQKLPPGRDARPAPEPAAGSLGTLAARKLVGETAARAIPVSATPRSQERR